jgi:hypothetical protein
VVPDSILCCALPRAAQTLVQAERTYCSAPWLESVNANAARGPPSASRGLTVPRPGTPGDIFGSQAQDLPGAHRASFPLFDKRTSRECVGGARACGAGACLVRGIRAAMPCARRAMRSSAYARARDEAVAQATQATALRQALDWQRCAMKRDRHVPRSVGCAAELVRRGVGAEPGSIRETVRCGAVVHGAQAEAGSCPSPPSAANL